MPLPRLGTRHRIGSNWQAEVVKASLSNVRFVPKADIGRCGWVGISTSQSPSRNRTPSQDYRNGRCHLLYHSSGASICDDYVDVSSQEFSREIAHTLGASPGPAIIDIDSLSRDPIEFSEAGDKSNRPRTPDYRVRTEYPDTPRIAHLLRVGGKRPRDDGATKTSNELPPLHELPRRGHSGSTENTRFSD